MEVHDFSGGKTDKHIGGPPNMAERVDNLVVNEYDDLIQRPGISQFQNLIDQIPPGTQRIDAMHFFDNTLFVKSGTRLYFAERGSDTWGTLNGPNTHAFADSELGAGCTFSEMHGHLYMTPVPVNNAREGCRTVKTYRDTTGTWRLVQAGLPTAPVPPAGIELPGGDSFPPLHNYIWYWCYTREYTALVNGVETTFKDYGNARLLTEAVCPSPRSNRPFKVPYVPFENGLLDNYRDGNGDADPLGIRIEIYRTRADLQTPLYVGAYFNVEHTLEDKVPDADLGDPLYIADGTVDYDPVPHSYGSMVVDNYAFYGAGRDIDSGEMHATRIYQSQANNADAVPATFYGEIPDIFTAMAFVGQYPIVFSENKCYRGEGRFDAFGQGALRFKLISHDEGCPFPASIIRREDMVMFVSKNGVCLTDGFKVLNVTRKHLTRSFDLLRNKHNIVGTFNAFEKRAYWAVEDRDNLPLGVNNSLWSFSIAGDTAALTTASSLNGNMQVTALAYDEVDQATVLGDKRGFVLALNAGETSDIVVDPSLPMPTWSRQAIVTDWISTAFDFGTSKLNKWVSQVYFTFINATGNLSLAVTSHNDDKALTLPLRDVRVRSLVGTGIHRVKRWFTKSGLSCLYKQMQITKGYVNITKSDDFTLALPNNALGVVQLLAGDWPLYRGHDLRNYSIFFEGDGYVKGHLITGQNGSELYVHVPDLDMPAGPQKWHIAGYPKDEFTHMKSMIFDYEVLGENYTGFRRGDDGFNT